MEGMKINPNLVLLEFKVQNKQLLAEIKRKDAALRFYADPSKYGDRGDYWQIVNDEGKTAR